MNKFQLVECLPNCNHAGSKAPADVCFFSEQEGYRKILFTSYRSGSVFNRINSYIECIKATFYIKRGSTLLIQYPYIPLGKISKPFYTLLSLKKIQIITLIHDLDELRFENNGKSKENFSYIAQKSSILIAHNQKMIDYLVKRGINNEKLVNLEIFDYKTVESEKPKENKFEKSIIIAGNLSVKKASYLADLSKLAKINFNLYGVNYKKDNFSGTNFFYKGVESPDNLPNKLDRGFGLVWDGNSIKTCAGKSGEYLKFNNPHKLSLYITAGIPVFIWKESAEAEFVEKNELGYTIDSLEDIESILNCITVSEYNEKCKNVQNFAKKLKTGEYIKKALEKSERKIR